MILSHGFCYNRVVIIDTDNKILVAISRKYVGNSIDEERVRVSTKKVKW